MDDMRDWARQLEEELLKGQEMVNHGNRRKNILEMHAIEANQYTP